MLRNHVRTPSSSTWLWWPPAADWAWRLCVVLIVSTRSPTAAYAQCGCGCTAWRCGERSIKRQCYKGFQMRPPNLTCWFAMPARSNVPHYAFWVGPMPAMCVCVRARVCVCVRARARVRVRSCVWLRTDRSRYLGRNACHAEMQRRAHTHGRTTRVLTAARPVARARSWVVLSAAACSASSFRCFNSSSL
jgi:hypothetical protein